MEQQSSIPQESSTKPRESQNAPFSHPQFAGRAKCSVNFVQDCSLRGKHIKYLRRKVGGGACRGACRACPPLTNESFHSR